ncbi:MAG: adenosylcobinamide-GDP ribazoletransferase [Euryarchaeota archaeon]|nr:adenosylcobinamide-GDP ribazoletransferase [Euryarchaeota archaeon]
MLRALRSCTGFLTVLPVGMGFRSYEELARGAWAFPLVGALVGLIAAAAAFVALLFLPKSIAAAVALAALLAVTGANHFDGLVDVADALMVRGSREAKLRVMHEPSAGSAGVAAGVLVLLMSYLALYEAPAMLSVLVVAEASAKFGMLLTCFSARRASHGGIGSAFVDAFRGNWRRLGMSFACYLPFLVVAWWSAPAVLLLTLFLALAAAELAERWFGGVSGDVLGAVNELVRLGVMLVMV